MKKLSLSLSLIGASLLSGIASVYAQVGVNINVGAQNDAPGQGLVNLVKLIQQLIGLAGPILLSLGVLAFFFGLIMFIWKGSEGEEKRKGWLQFMGYALIAIFAMVSVWGIVAFIGSTLGIGNVQSIPTPALPVTPKVY